MANKTARRKFRVPLKEGTSLPCSQASSASGLAEVSQPQAEREKESSQSWLSQLSVKADVSPSSNKTTSAKFSTAKPTLTKELEVPIHETVRSKGGHGIFSLDDSLCSIGVENENSSNSGDSANGVTQDSLSGSNAIASPGEHLHQGTQTHTVLSFCSEASTPAPVCELRKEVSAAIGKFQVIEYALDEPTDDIIVDSEDEETETEQGNLKDPGESRFQRKNKPATRRYDYSKILPRFGPQKGKKGLSKNAKTATKKRVTLDLVVNTCGFSKTSASAAVSGAGRHDTMAKGDLSVYDYQPTPQQEGRPEGGGVETTSELNNSNWISKRTREEQVSAKE